jgi:glycosyltransferase involved in cell wall biosynthesis
VSAPPRVSVVIPVRDQPDFLAASLETVFRQPYGDLEVIVVDDGSTVSLAPALARWGDAVRVERQEPLGVAAASNRGAALARGEILAFHDADDLMEPGRITVPLAILDRDPGVALVFGNGLAVSADLAPLGPVIPERHAARLARRGLTLAELVRRSHVYLQASLIRRAVFLALGGLPPFRAGGDWGFALRCVAHHRVAFVNAPLFRYRRHGASLTAGRVAMAEAAVAVLRDFLANEPEAAARLGARRMRRAVARRLVRLAAQETRTGRHGVAREHLAEAVALAPWDPRYRWRLLGATRRAGS